MIDISNFSSMTPEQAVTTCNSAVAQPGFIILFLTFMISFIIFGFIFIKKNRDKLALISTCTFVTAGIVLLILFFMPITTQSIVDFFKTLFS